MPRVSDLPIGLKPYAFHGIEIRDNVNQGLGECPFCSKPKFHANPETAQWDCKSCSSKGNVYTFLKKLWEASSAATGMRELKSFSSQLQVLPETLVAWGACKSVVTGEWLMPGYGTEKNLTQLYRYVKDSATGKMRWMCTPGPGNNPGQALEHAVHGANLLTGEERIIYVCEGPSDGMALWETMQVYKDGGKKYMPTANKQASLLKNSGVIAVPGASVFKERWAKLLEGKVVRLAFDSDHPRETKAKLPPVNQELNGHSKNGKPDSNGKTTGGKELVVKMPGPGLAGMKNVVKVLSRSAEKPEKVEYLRWGPEGYDQSKKDGWDVRDELNKDPKRKGDSLQGIVERFHPIPPDWVNPLDPGKSGSVAVQTKFCDKWATLIDQMRRALKSTPGLERALAVMLSSAMSVEQPEDQLWVKIMGPPSSAKSTLCEALATATKHTKMISVIRGFHSGYKTDKEGKEDNSLLHQLRNKTLITKDGDTLLQAGNLSQILSEARDIYDKVSSTAYRNATSRTYQGLKLTWILCGTASLRALDNTELGERFLNCIIMDKIDTDLEREVNRIKINQLRRVMGKHKGQTHHSDGEMAKFQALTGGYLEYLRANATKLIDGVEMSDRNAELITVIGTFVAHMRARPSIKQDEEYQREMSTRLVSQLGKLAFCLAAVMNKDSVDDEVMRWVIKVAQDTARGKSLNIARQLYKHGPAKGMNQKAIALTLNDSGKTLDGFLRFLCGIDVLESFSVQGYSEVRYRLTKHMSQLYKEVADAMRLLGATKKD